MDNYGRIGKNEAENMEPTDDYGRLWTIGSALQNRMVSVASQIPPPIVSAAGLCPLALSAGAPGP
jgi:hypothetical protein